MGRGGRRGGEHFHLSLSCWEDKSAMILNEEAFSHSNEMIGIVRNWETDDVILHSLLLKDFLMSLLKAVVEKLTEGCSLSSATPVTKVDDYHHATYHVAPSLAECLLLNIGWYSKKEGQDQEIPAFIFSRQMLYNIGSDKHC